MYSRALFDFHLATTMVDNTLESVKTFLHQSIGKSPGAFTITGPNLLVTRIHEPRIAPLMAQPYEVINVTGIEPVQTPVVKKPPEKPTG